MRSAWVGGAWATVNLGATAGRYEWQDNVVAALIFFIAVASGIALLCVVTRSDLARSQ